MSESTMEPTKRRPVLSHLAALLAGGALVAMLPRSAEPPPPAPATAATPVAPAEELDNTNDSPKLQHLGWGYVAADGLPALRVSYAMSRPAPNADLHAPLPFVTVPAFSRLLEWAERTAPTSRTVESRKVQITPSVTFVNRAMKGTRFGNEGHLYIGLALSFMGTTENPPPRVFAVTALPAEIQALVSEIDIAAETTMRADFQKRLRGK